MTLPSKYTGGMGSHFGLTQNLNNLYTSSFAHELRNHDYFLTLNKINRRAGCGTTRSYVNSTDLDENRKCILDNLDDSETTFHQKDELKKSESLIPRESAPSFENTEQICDVKVNYYSLLHTVLQKYSNITHLFSQRIIF